MVGGLQARERLDLALHYDNPAVGEDEFDEQAPVGYKFDAGGPIENRVVRFKCDSQTCDGIPDDWKRNGVTIDPGGGQPAQFVDLPKMGVTIDRPTVMIHMDWMEDTATPPNSWKPRQDAIDNVINAFDRSPVTYRGATGPASRWSSTPVHQHHHAGRPTWGTLSRAQSFAWSRYFLTGNRVTGFQQANFFTRLRANFVPTGRLPIFHYAVAADVISQDTRCDAGDTANAGRRRQHPPRGAWKLGVHADLGQLERQHQRLARRTDRHVDARVRPRPRLRPQRR